MLYSCAEISAVSQTDNGQGGILKGVSGIAGYNLQSTSARYREWCIHGKGYFFIGSSEGVASHCSGYGNSVQCELDRERRGDGGPCIYQDCTGKEGLIDAGLVNLHIRRTSSMGNGSSGYQRSFIKNQCPVSRSGLRGCIYCCQDFRSPAASGLPAGNDEIKDCIF